MFDPVRSTLDATAGHASFAPALALVAGAASSLGPCVAPRYVALAGLLAGRSQQARLRVAAAFVGGVFTAYATFALSAALLAGVARVSHLFYAGVALAFACGGFVTLRRRAACEQRGRAAQLGSTFVLGASLAVGISPCCAPVIAGVAAYTVSTGNGIYGAAVLGAFALGHSAPLALAVTSGKRLRVPWLDISGDVWATIGAALLLALGAFYAVLA